MNNIKSITELSKELEKNPQSVQEIKADPQKVIDTIKKNQEIPNTLVYHIVVSALGLSIILVIIAVAILASGSESPDVRVPTIYTAIASGAIGALAGLLAPQPPKAN